MADVRLKCAKCGKEVAVSEFARMDGLRCSCGEALKKDDSLQSEVAKPKRSALILKTQEQIEAAYGTPKDPGEWRLTQQANKNKGSERQPRNTRLLLSWLVFVVLAGVMGYLRYAPNNLFPDLTHLLKQYGIFAFGALYVTIILSALKDTVFQGLLCLIPLYPFYYILMVSDDFFLRAVVCGVMVGIGKDSFWIINDWMTFLINFVQAWIAHGG